MSSARQRWSTGFESLPGAMAQVVIRKHEVYISPRMSIVLDATVKGPDPAQWSAKARAARGATAPSNLNRDTSLQRLSRVDPIMVLAVIAWIAVVAVAFLALYSVLG